MFESVTLLLALVHAVLVPTTTHPQLRDSRGEAWMEIRAKRVMILHAPRAGQLQLRIRSASARKLRIRAGGEQIAEQKLDPRVDPNADLAGAPAGAITRLRIPVPTGGEIFRLQISRGKAWVAAALVSNGTLENYAQPDSEKPILVSLGAPKKNKGPGLVKIGSTKAPSLARLGGSKKQSPGLVGLGHKKPSDPRRMSFGKKEEMGPVLVGLGDRKKNDTAGPAAFERPVTELPTLNPDEDALVTRAPRKEPIQPPPAGPITPSLIERLIAGGIPLTIGGGAEARAGAVGGQVEAELPLPGRRGLFAAALSIGYSQSRLVGVATGANGTAAPLTLTTQQNDLPLAFSLRVRPLSLPVGSERLTFLGELGAAWSVREEGLTLDAHRALVGNGSTALGQQINGTSGFTGQIGLGAEVSVGRLRLGAGMRYQLAAATESALGDRVRVRRSQTAPAMHVVLRYRFGSGT
jgi:hypothetical protein